VICYLHFGVRCERAWHHEPGYMAWYVKVSHPKIIPPDDGSPPRPANQEQLLEEEQAKEMSDTLTIIREMVHISDGMLAMSDQLSREELLHVLTQISSIDRPTLMYQIAKQRRGHMHRRQKGWLLLDYFMYILTMVMYYYDIFEPILFLWHFSIYIISCVLNLSC